MKFTSLLISLSTLFFFPSIAGAQDRDGDGLTDWWETKYNECMWIDIYDSDVNWDSDAAEEWEEYLNGTNPCFYNGCSDGLDNDEDGYTDWPADPDCLDRYDPNELKPVLVGQYHTFIAHNVYLSGDLAYVADDNNGLKIIDISNPLSPSLVGSLETIFALDVYVSGNYAYVAGDGDGLSIVSIRDPSNPILVGGYQYPCCSAFRGVKVVGNYAYLADSFNGGITIINISNPSAPIWISRY